MLSIIGCTLTKNKSNYASELSTFRQEYKDGFLHDERSPLTKDDLPFLDFYPADPAWKLTCQCTKIENAKTFDMPTYSGVTRLYQRICYGRLQVQRKRYKIEYLPKHDSTI
ncbi:MAG: hypothetical protein IPO94_06545 [Saprospiraceae bacterium]|nr:hypothetical protein [Saprospiraceae bacterium]